MMPPNGPAPAATPTALGDVLALLSDYFDALYEADAARLSGLFHPFAIYVTVVDRGALVRTMDEYLPIVAARVSPRASRQPRDDAVLSLQRVAPTVIVAIIRTRLGDVRYTNALTLLEVGSEWKIASKVIHSSPA